jgi:hypothetical protein
MSVLSGFEFKRIPPPAALIGHPIDQVVVGTADAATVNRCQQRLEHGSDPAD